MDIKSELFGGKLDIVKDVLVLSTVPLVLLKHAESVQEGVLFMAAIAAYNYFMFAHNDFMDKDIDALEPSKRRQNLFTDEKYEKLAFALMVSSGLVFLAMGLLDVRKAYLNVLLLVIAYNYNAGIRAKNKPFLDVIFHGLWIVGMLAYGIAFFGVTPSVKEFLLLYQFAVISTLVEISQEIRDYEGDKETNEQTTVVYFGLKSSKVAYALFVLSFALVTPVFVENVYVRFLPLVFIPIHFFVRQEEWEQRAPPLFGMMVLSYVAYLA